MKVKHFILFFTFFSPYLFASSYRIVNVDYEIKGSTRKYALERKVDIDKKKIFADEDELIKYINDYKQRVENTRVFDDINVDFTVGESNDEEPLPVSIKVGAKDSLHLLVAPYPKYNSNSGFKFQLKVKDTNFLGLMETLTGDFSFAVVQNSKDEDEPAKYKFGFSTDFAVPFKMGKINSSWNNVIDISYTIRNTTPEWKLKTGLECSLPYDKFPLNFEFYQSFIRDLDYEDTVINGKNIHYGDGTYFVEYAKLSVPIRVQEISGWGSIYYTPFIDGTYNWDHNRISELNSDLLGPEMGIGQTLSASRINWIENFRNGVSASLTQSYTYNFKTFVFSPGLQGEIKFYKAFKQLGIATDIYAFAYMYTSKNIGSRLRGIRDDQYFASGSGAEDKKACDTPAAVVINLDLPIKIFKAHWKEVPVIKHIPLVKYFDMELQLSPFVDVAFIKNRATDTDFSYKDGFLSGGLEMIIYPLRWKGIQVRGSFGVDLGRKMPGIKGRLNQDWRKGVSSYEISIGIGLHY